ncbi:MAG: hypothetical protein WBN92_11620, partial [Terriglobia bacterium]
FMESIKGLWEVVSELETPWIADGRRTLVLKRILPPPIQKSQLGNLELVIKRENKWRDNWTIYKTREGYYKETSHITPLLVYSTVSKVMRWEDMVRWVVYDGDLFSGFVVKDYGETPPGMPAISEELYVSVLNWSLPLGFLPADVARSNIRIHQGVPIWIDIEFAALNELDAFLALWSVTNTYKQYDVIPDRANPANHRS